jgi:hypothetical protein
MNNMKNLFKIISVVTIIFSCITKPVQASAKEPPMPKVGYEYCPKNIDDITDANAFPGFDPNNEKSFSRDQDAIGMCTSNAVSDYLCARLKADKVFDKMPTAIRNQFLKSGCSALDIHIQAFDKMCKGKVPYTLQTAFNSNNTGGMPACLNSSVESILNVAAERGLCPESSIPSEFANFKSRGGEDGLKNLLLSLSERIRSRKAGTEAAGTEAGMCAECALTKNLATDQVDAIKKALSKNDPSEDFSKLMEITSIACPEDVRKLTRDAVREIAKNVKNGSPRDNSPIAQILQNQQLAIITLPASRLNPFISSAEDGGHSVVVYTSQAVKVKKVFHGREWIEEKCYFGIKNSWGMQCKETKKKIADAIERGELKSENNPFRDDFDGAPNILCSKSGAFMVARGVIESAGAFITAKKGSWHNGPID